MECVNIGRNAFRGFLIFKLELHMADLLYKSEVYDIVGVCMEVYNNLGYGFLEIVYKDAMEMEFGERKMRFTREDEFKIYYKGNKLHRSFFSDFTLHGCIIVEVKANADGIPEGCVSQTLNYLKASGNKLGLVINFGKKRLEYKRIVF